MCSPRLPAPRATPGHAPVVPWSSPGGRGAPAGEARGHLRVLPGLPPLSPVPPGSGPTPLRRPHPGCGLTLPPHPRFAGSRRSAAMGSRSGTPSTGTGTGPGRCRPFAAAAPFASPWRPHRARCTGDGERGGSAPPRGGEDPNPQAAPDPPRQPLPSAGTAPRAGGWSRARSIFLLGWSAAERWKAVKWGERG